MTISEKPFISLTFVELGKWCFVIMDTILGADYAVSSGPITDDKNCFRQLLFRQKIFVPCIHHIIIYRYHLCTIFGASENLYYTS